MSERINYILTWWIKLKLRQKNIVTSHHMPDEVIDIYNEYEERKRLNKIKISLLFKDEYFREKQDN